MLSRGSAPDLKSNGRPRALEKEVPFEFSDFINVSFIKFDSHLILGSVVPLDPKARNYHVVGAERAGGL